MKTRLSQEIKGNKLNASKSLGGLSCLITGFDPFSEHGANPSATVALSMPKQFVLQGQHVSVSRLVLPTQGERAWFLLKEAVTALPANEKRVIILLGLAADRKVINIERFALNIRDYRIKDNDGNIFVGKKIYQKAPEAIRTKAPIEEALSRLSDKGLPAAISNFCGSFVCNETYFRLLHYLKNSDSPSLVSFIHVPLPRAYGMALKKDGAKRYQHLADNRENQLKAMSKAIKIVAQFYCEYMVRK